MQYLLLILGLVLLIAGGEFALRGAIGLARRMRISTAVIGLTVMGFGTSTPELVVAVQAVLTGNSDIAVGNVFGSNIANTLLILGVGALIGTLSCDPRAVRRDGVVMLLAAALACGLGATGGIVFWQGVVMLACLFAFMWASYRHDVRSRDAVKGLHESVAKETSGIPAGTLGIALYIVSGFGGLIYGAAMLVESAVSIASAAGVSQTIIGLTLVAFGTSLPELAATVVAVYRRHTDIAIANALGSNIFNILGVLGAGALFGPLEFSGRIATYDQWIMLGAAAILLPVMISGWRVSRIEGAALLAAYTAYIGSLILRA